MGRNVRRQFDNTFKTKVVIKALRERKTLTDLCKECDLHPNQISDWKKLILCEILTIFDTGSTKQKKSQDMESYLEPKAQKI